MRNDTSTLETGGASPGERPGERPRGPLARRRTASRAAPQKRPRPLAQTKAAIPATLLAPSSSEATEAACRQFKLVRSSDRAPGYTRRLAGKRFAYFDCNGTRIRDPEVIARIGALAIPPAYTDVWICTDERGHLQATGRDARGRKQYRYHPGWRDQRDRDKFAKLAEFARALPRIRARVDADLRLRGLPREKVVAAVVRLLDSTLVRIGNDEYVRQNSSYGLTTVRKRHLRADGGTLTLCFNGKHGIAHEVAIDDASVVRIVRSCVELPGRELFRYLDNSGKGSHRVTAEDVNAWLREAAGEAFTAKDYRTWAASAVALDLLRAAEPPRSTRAARSTVAQVAREVAALLRNTPAVCRNSYIHPLIIEAYCAGELPALRCRVRRAGLSAQERMLATLLDARTPR